MVFRKTTEPLSSALTTAQAQYQSSNKSKSSRNKSNQLPYINNNTNSNNERYFSACMITMDDNHFWSEFLAYHFTFLNLRRLIVAVDPRSKTSPSGIFDQWKGLINITQWKDDDFMQGCEKYKGDFVKTHRCRQRRLYAKCSQVLKKEERTTWVAFIDVDEYIVPNWMAGPLDRITTYQPEMNILDIFDANPHLNGDFKFSCFPMSRIPVTVHESPPEQVFQRVPVGINATSLMTLRYRYPRVTRKNLPGKAMLDFSKIPWDVINRKDYDTHRPIRSQCDEDEVWMNPWTSAFLTYHYAGSLEAFQFRDDPRKAERRTEKHYFEKYGNMDGSFEDDSPRFWISNFVSKVGLQQAKQLLKDSNVVKVNG